MAADVTAGLVERLEWDSEFFGFPVGHIREPESNQTAIAAALREAEDCGYELLYWTAAASNERPRFETPGFVLSYTDHRIEYALDIGASRAVSAAAFDGEIEIAQHTGGPAPDEILDLAPEAGAYSRFQQDPRVSEAKFVALYRAWVSRSASTDFADTMLVASVGSRPIGFVTGEVDGNSGAIGLIAVNTAFQSRRVGEQLLAAFVEWLATRGAADAVVLTQRENPARRFYEKAGFKARSTSHIHHLWRARDLQ